MKTLIFIDTNIYLDFYRLESREAGLAILDKIKKHHNILITGDQIGMEFKKNRQRVILDVYRAMKGPDWSKISLPPVLAESRASRSLEKHKKEVNKQAAKLRQRLFSVLTKPSAYDPVYKTVQQLLKSRGPYNLSGDKDIRLEIRELAEKRYKLGYPPKKVGDTSFGDAINWEWIIRCATKSRAGVIIVTRDTDYGTFVEGNPILNDWLKEEFKSRVGKKSPIELTDRMAVAFKATNIQVTKTEEDEEIKLIDTKSEESITKTYDQLWKYLMKKIEVEDTGYFGINNILTPRKLT